MDLPRPDHPESDIRAWMFDGEREWLAALDCPDLTARISVELCLTEHKDYHGRRKRGKKYAVTAPRTPEQDVRFSVASGLLESRLSALRATRAILFHVAELRRELHYAEKGVPDAE